MLDLKINNKIRNKRIKVVVVMEDKRASVTFLKILQVSGTLPEGWREHRSSKRFSFRLSTICRQHAALSFSSRSPSFPKPDQHGCAFPLPESVCLTLPVSLAVLMATGDSGVLAGACH